MSEQTNCPHTETHVDCSGPETTIYCKFCDQELSRNEARMARQAPMTQPSDERAETRVAEEWQPADTTPTEKGWYECRAIDDRWSGETRYRAWGNGLWWTPLIDGWLSSRDGIYEWRGPVADVNGPAPDGTNPKPVKV